MIGANNAKTMIFDPATETLSLSSDKFAILAQFVKAEANILKYGMIYDAEST